MDHQKEYIAKATEIDEKYKRTPFPKYSDFKLEEEKGHIRQPKLKNIEYFINGGEKDEVDKFTMFNDWCQKEGAIMPHLEYPAYFDGGLLGVKCKKDIKYHEAYMCIPFKMIMSLEKAYIHPVLKKIIDENQDCFGADFNQDFEQMTLAMFIVYEMTLGKELYW